MRWLSDRCPGLTERSRIRCRVGFLAGWPGGSTPPHPLPPLPGVSPKTPQKCYFRRFFDLILNFPRENGQKSQKICL